MTSAPIEIKRIHGFGYNADTVRSWIHAEGPLARNSWFGYKCVVDLVGFELPNRPL